MNHTATHQKFSVVILDNFDSFTYNLVDQCRALGYPVTVYRNTLDTAFIEARISELSNPLLLLSPGPGRPADAGCMPDLIEQLRGKVPMIGICLGHQALVEAYGGQVGAASSILHGKSSVMTCKSHPVLTDLTSPLVIARYHSLIAQKVPDTLRVIGETEGAVMAVVNDTDRVIGFQFHPESILTTQGAALLTNAIQWACGQENMEVH